MLLLFLLLRSGDCDALIADWNRSLRGCVVYSYVLVLLRVDVLYWLFHYSGHMEWIDAAAANLKVWKQHITTATEDTIPEEGDETGLSSPLVGRSVAGSFLPEGTLMHQQGGGWNRSALGSAPQQSERPLDMDSFRSFELDYKVDGDVGAGEKREKKGSRRRTE